MKRRKSDVLALLERGPATTGEVRLHCGCNSAQALGSLYWLRDCGAITGTRVQRTGAGPGTKLTTLWRIAS